MDNRAFLNVGVESDDDFVEITLKNRPGPNGSSVTDSDLAIEDHIGHTIFFFLWVC